MLKKIIGIIILVIIFAGLFYVIVKTSSLKDALIIWVTAILLSGAIIGAVFLITGD